MSSPAPDTRAQEDASLDGLMQARFGTEPVDAWSGMLASDPMGRAGSSTRTTIRASLRRESSQAGGAARWASYELVGL